MRSQSLQNNRNRFSQERDMDTRTPNAASSKASSLRRASRHEYSQPSTETLVATGSIERSTSTWHGSLISRDGPSHEQRYPTECGSVTASDEHRVLQHTCPPPPAPPTPPHFIDYPEELAQMILTMGSGRHYEDLADAFRHASDLPPITKQSLGELDIQHIITNVRLRHDVNFDNDLSFRPNLDGAKGQQKRQTTNQYWKALEAELEIFARLFQGTPTPKTQKGESWTALVQNAQRRIPVMFQTVQEVLKSLVPDRDHARVDEHLDVAMLMQEIQRGVCNLVRLAEWMAQLLKEHCAPMRDSQVDGMVTAIRTGVKDRSSKQIVEGLRDLFGILETMKLDVANHQIRNLKTQLVEDTINFEKHYHLDRLVSHRSRVNIDAAQAWYRHVAFEFADEHSTQPRHIPQMRLQIFVRAVIAQLFKRNGLYELPETFYLDQDRLRTIKAEIEDLIHIEVCMDAFATLLRQFGFDGSVSPTIRHRLHASLLAIMGNAIGHGSQQWVINSEALSLEIIRQASLVAGQNLTLSHDSLSRANDQLLRMFHSSVVTHIPRLETILLERVITCTQRHTNSATVDLFNNLIPIANANSLQSSHFSHLHTTNTSSFPPTLNPETTKWQEVANRITHIVLVHWRVWERIAYVQEDESKQTTSHLGQESFKPSPQSVQSSQTAPLTSELESQMVTTMKTGDSLETGPETLVPHETRSQ